MSKDEKLNISEVSQILNVSQATIKNWLKTGVIAGSLTLNTIEKLKKSIEYGEILRLDKRANKNNSNKNFIPKEYLNNAIFVENIDKITKICNNYFATIEEKLLNIVCSFLIENNEIISNEIKFLFKRKIIEKIITDYYYNFKININFFYEVRENFKNFEKNNDIDILGVLYQSILSEGEKSKAGSYYTPNDITQSIISDLKNIETFLDPCCGTGSFLLNVAKIKNLLPENIYGVDIDKNAVFIAKINLLFKYKDYQKEPNIYCTDFLNNFKNDNLFSENNFSSIKIDAVATNPPWGASKNSSPSTHYEKLLGSKEIYSMFIAKSIEIVKKDGECIFLLPESILNIKTHKAIRKILTENTQILSIKEYGRAFTGVFTPVISIHFCKENSKINNLINVKTLSDSYFIEQTRIKNSSNYIFDIKINSEIDDLIKKIYTIPHQTLTNNASWALGIVTGNNSKYLKSEQIENLEPIYKGSDIELFTIKKPSNFIKYEREKFQQIAKNEFYRASEKLLYKFISNKLVFAYDNKQSLTLNSANILIPNIPNYSIKATLAFLNSTVFQFLFRNKFNTHKVLKNDLEQLPFPEISQKQNEILEKLVDNYFKKSDNLVEINDCIYNIFNITQIERENIEKNI